MLTLRKFVSSIMMLTVAGLFVVGCNENDPGVTPPGDDVNPISRLMATSLDATTVGLQWTASTTTGATYTITVLQGATPVDTVDAGVATASSVSGLTAGTVYTFSIVASNTDGDESDAVTIMWSPASRYTSDDAVTGKLRIYARSVVGKGSGIVITANGASNALTAASQPNLDAIHLVADVNDVTDQIRIGAPNAFTDFQAQMDGKFRTDVEVSTDVFTTSGLDAWYRGSSLEGLFGATGGEKFHTVGNVQTGNDGVAFAIRYGAAGAQNYAKVFLVPDASGNLIQEENGDKYGETHLSSRAAQNTPYAKN